MSKQQLRFIVTVEVIIDILLILAGLLLLLTGVSGWISLLLVVFGLTGLAGVWIMERRYSRGGEESEDSRVGGKAANPRGATPVEESREEPGE